MLLRMSSHRSLCLLLLASSVACARAQLSAPAIEAKGTARPPNVDGTYGALRAALPGGEGLSVKDLTLQREGGIFHFDQGSFYLYGAVGGRTTGAVFLGRGRFNLAPKEAAEQHSLALLAKNGVMEQEFSTLVLRFTDATADELRKASAGPANGTAGAAVSAARDFAISLREHLHQNIDLRLLEDAIVPRDGGYFLASFRMGGLLTGKQVLFSVDPDSQPDQVELATWSDDLYQTWAAYRADSPALRGTGGAALHVSDEKLDVTIASSGSMRCNAETTLTLRQDGLRVLRLNLYPTLRVSGVFSETGQPLDFVQEDKTTDPAFAAILPRPAKAGDTLRLLIHYEGKDALESLGNGVFFLLPAARESWYPSGSEALGGFANFHMTFHLPRNTQIVATGKQLSNAPEPGGGTRAVWATDTPIPVAGFNLGDFKMQETKTPQGFIVDAYANLAHEGTRLATTEGLKDQLAQGTAAVQVYTHYFGKLPFDHVALTEQDVCNFGQSWPMLVYLPACAFLDAGTQNLLGVRSFGAASYWKEVTPHEVSHQWWGQLVGFNGYRDQWMSEGFANFSVGIYLLETDPKMDAYRQFWNEQHRNLLDKNRFGVRPIDAGALTMGVRVANQKTGNIYQDLIYSKGAYVMHMLEMMYWTPANGEAPFQKSMQAFVSEFAGKAATTEDLKHSFERTMPRWVDLKGNGKLDWFFDEYIYGTELPHYTIASDFTVADGETSAHYKLTQSGVSPSFLMMVPLYLQMENGNTVRIANITMAGEQTIERTYKLGKLPSPGKKLLINYNADVLSDQQ